MLTNHFKITLRALLRAPLYAGIKRTQTLLSLLFLFLLVQNHALGQWTKLPKAENLEIRQIIKSNGRLLCASANGVATSTDGGQHWERLAVNDRFKHISIKVVYGRSKPTRVPVR
jgi:hypothetical protein